MQCALDWTPTPPPSPKATKPGAWGFLLRTEVNFLGVFCDVLAHKFLRGCALLYFTLWDIVCFIPPHHGEHFLFSKAELEGLLDP